MILTNQKSGEWTELSIGSFRNPVAVAAPNLVPFVVALPLVVFPMGRDEFDSPIAQALAQRVGVDYRMGDYRPWPLSRLIFGSQEAGLLDRRFRKHNSCRREAFQSTSQRKTLTVDHFQEPRLLTMHSFTDPINSFWSGLSYHPGMCHPTSANFRIPATPSGARHISNCTPSSCDYFSRQQVEGGGNSSARDRHAAPDRGIARMPTKQTRLETYGRPRLSSLLRTLDKNSIKHHYSSTPSFCRPVLKKTIREPSHNESI
ncbi:MAG: hypothetical protein ACP5M4_10115 [Acidobacteriaceae bacterium]